MSEDKQLSPEELMRRQAILDRQWQAMLDEKERLRELAELRSFNKAPGDPDWATGGGSVERRRKLGFWSLGNEEDLY